MGVLPSLQQKTFSQGFVVPGTIWHAGNQGVIILIIPYYIDIVERFIALPAIPDRPISRLIPLLAAFSFRGQIGTEIALFV